ncbi:hypothetical protein RRG08_023720 [Elysia crispata]|uniref:Uncharacterized protein n=1 Tax=Elysia crispata TaxID=231223 RepID=A0AAE1D898_9GAST|nr:hypothetical protein RRG08_023720 [Elysia crispata]
MIKPLVLSLARRARKLSGHHQCSLPSPPQQRPRPGMIVNPCPKPSKASGEADSHHQCSLPSPPQQRSRPGMIKPLALSLARRARKLSGHHQCNIPSLPQQRSRPDMTIKPIALSLARRAGKLIATTNAVYLLLPSKEIIWPKHNLRGPW